jgi:succinate dehydrogenase / fumarate reductase cytochrome b subunit
MNSNQRPLSPHLQIYRPQWTSVLSIMHRISGVALSVGTLLMVLWLAALASGEAAFSSTLAFLSHPLVLVVMVAWTLALFYHLLNGIRHLLWDAGMLMDLGPARSSGWVVVVLALMLTALVWGGLV